MKVCIITLGCKVNQYESNQIAAHYLADGHEVVQKFVPDADIYIVNTCAVTSAAEKKSRNLASRVKRANPDAKVTVCGCAGDRTLNKSLTCHALQPRKRAFIKVQDGCNNYCSYCIVPYIRGRSQSRPTIDIISEIRTAAKPVVLTGIDLSSYGLDIGTTLRELCLAVDKCGFPFELSSIEVGIITSEFIKTLKNCTNFIPKFHVPLQSGSDKVLRDMNRKYTAGEYLSAIELIRAHFPAAAISTDVIIGFPTESPEDLAKTHELIAKVGFTHVHTFPYSRREGTAAAKLL